MTRFRMLIENATFWCGLCVGSERAFVEVSWRWCMFFKRMLLKITLPPVSRDFIRLITCPRHCYSLFSSVRLICFVCILVPPILLLCWIVLEFLFGWFSTWFHVPKAWNVFARDPSVSLFCLTRVQFRIFSLQLCFSFALALAYFLVSISVASAVLLRLAEGSSCCWHHRCDISTSSSFRSLGQGPFVCLDSISRVRLESLLYFQPVSKTSVIRNVLFLYSLRSSFEDPTVSPASFIHFRCIYFLLNFSLLRSSFELVVFFFESRPGWCRISEAFLSLFRPFHFAFIFVIRSPCFSVRFQILKFRNSRNFSDLILSPTYNPQSAISAWQRQCCMTFINYQELNSQML